MKETPVPYLLVRHRVKEYATWKKVFDEDARARKAAGCLGGQLFRNHDDPEDVMVLLAWDSADKARAFTLSTPVREVMGEAGVIGVPSIVFLGDTERVEV